MGHVLVADMDGQAVAERAAVLLRGEQLVGKGVVDHGVRHLPVVGQRHGDVAVMQAADKVGGTVDGVHDKRPRAGQGRVLPLLAEEVRLRQQRQQLPLQKALHRHVILGDEVGGAGLFRGDLLDVVSLPHHVPGKADDALQLPQHICSHSVSLLMTVPARTPVYVSRMTAGSPATSTASSPDAIRQGS